MPSYIIQQNLYKTVTLGPTQGCPAIGFDKFLEHFSQSCCLAGGPTVVYSWICNVCIERLFVMGSVFNGGSTVHCRYLLTFAQYNYFYD